MKRKIKAKKNKQSPAELILVQYKELCLGKMEGGEGKKLCYKDAKNRVEKTKGKKALVKFLKEIDLVILRNHLQNYFPYTQAYHYLREMILERICELEKIKIDDENWKNSEEYVAE